MTQATSMYTYINEFAKKPGNGKFPNILRADVVRDLKKRMVDPTLINQSVASLCGPAALAYIMLKHSPEMYAGYIMSLYDTGAARIHELHVKPGQDCRNANPGAAIAGIDWIGLASLRDSENLVFDYQKPTDTFSGITMPGGIQGWFKELRLKDVKEETNLIRTKPFSNLKEAANLYAAGYFVCLFLWGDVVKGNIPGFFSTPNHWAVMSKYPVFSAADTVGLQVFTWGGTYVIPPLKRNDFLKAYYGYVAGKWS